MRKRKY